jgi:heme A synthase
MKRYPQFAWGVVAYNIGVILWGAFVRATGSGAGCGSHWPLCNGEVLPRAPQIETLIEFIHRITSGLALILVIVLFLGAVQGYRRHHLVRYVAFAALVFTLIEALIGAGLVLFELVAHNASLARAFAMMAHLINTLLLLAALTLTAEWASQPEMKRPKVELKVLWPFLAGWVGMFVLGASGAVTALGDTLFPATSLRAGLLQDFSPTVHFLVRLRVFHPLIAVLVGSYWIGLAQRQGKARGDVIARVLTTFIVVQWLLGVANVVLLAPVWMQLVHLLLTDLIWVAQVLLTVRRVLRFEPFERSADHAVHYGVNQTAQEASG